MRQEKRRKRMYLETKENEKKKREKERERDAKKCKREMTKPLTVQRCRSVLSCREE